MSRKERRGPRAERIRTLLQAGDHAAARAEARATLHDPTASEPERTAASQALASLAPERGAVVAGVLGVAGALALSAFVLLRG
jgi:hypothetical protein